jgi:DNA-binding NtrC family response regulator
MTAADTLEDAGFQMLGGCSEDVQVLLTDVNMSGSMNGMALAERVYQRWPPIRLLIASGYARLHPDEIRDCGQFVPKPYRGDTLVQQIAEIM